MFLCTGLVVIALLGAFVCTQDAFGDGQGVDLETFRQRLACQQRHPINNSAVISTDIQPTMTCYGTVFGGDQGDIFPNGDEDDRTQKATQEAKEAWKTIERHVLDRELANLESGSYFYDPEFLDSQVTRGGKACVSRVNAAKGLMQLTARGTKNIWLQSGTYRIAINTKNGVKTESIRVAEGWTAERIENVCLKAFFAYFMSSKKKKRSVVDGVELSVAEKTAQQPGACFPVLQTSDRIAAPKSLHLRASSRLKLHGWRIKSDSRI